MSAHKPATDKVALVAGASPGFGAALCGRLLEAGYRVAAVGREPALEALRRTVPVDICASADLTDPGQTSRAFSQAESALGPVTAVVVNTARLVLAPSLKTDVKAFSECLDTNCLSAFIVAQRCIPSFLERGGGTLVFTGATASIRGGKQSAAFAASKFALRGLSQALAREFSPSGVHVVHVVVDGLIWSERTRERFSATKSEDCIQPSELAELYLQLIEQPRSTWTHEIDVRPSHERF
jgi:NAD(P)-dependent dehydrogenase (short-subunit alcohol dehydrogenase family)